MISAMMVVLAMTLAPWPLFSSASWPSSLRWMGRLTLSWGVMLMIGSGHTASSFLLVCVLLIARLLRLRWHHLRERLAWLRNHRSTHHLRRHTRSPSHHWIWVSVHAHHTGCCWMIRRVTVVRELWSHHSGWSYVRARDNIGSHSRGRHWGTTWLPIFPAFLTLLAASRTSAALTWPWPFSLLSFLFLIPLEHLHISYFLIYQHIHILYSLALLPFLTLPTVLFIVLLLFLSESIRHILLLLLSWSYCWLDFLPFFMDFKVLDSVGWVIFHRQELVFLVVSTHSAHLAATVIRYFLPVPKLIHRFILPESV